jgi:hypothetical protein
MPVKTAWPAELVHEGAAVLTIGCMHMTRSTACGFQVV